MIELNRSRFRLTLRCLPLLSQLAAFALLAFACVSMRADDFEWNTGEGDWSLSANWTPSLGAPPASSDTALIGSLPAAQNAAVFLNITTLVGEVQMTNGTSLSTDGFQLSVLGDTLLDEDSGEVILHVDSSGLVYDYLTDSLDVLQGAEVQLHGGVLRIGDVLTVDDQGSAVSGFGTIIFEGASTVLTLDGELATSGPGLTLDATTGGGSIDLDGTSEMGMVLVEVGDSDLTINGQLTDTFSGTMSLGGGGGFNTITVTQAWTADEDAQIDINAGPVGRSEIAGATLDFFGAMGIQDGEALISADINVESGAGVEVGGQGSPATLRLDGTALFDAGADLIFADEDAHLEVHGMTTINQTTFDWDSLGSAGNTTTIGQGGTLLVNSSQIDPLDGQYDGTINIQGGTLEVNNPTADEWAMHGQMDLQGSTINGDRILVHGTVQATDGFNDVNAETRFGTNADLTVTGGATLRLDAANRFDPDSSIQVDSDSLLQLIGPTTWAGPTLVTGTGTIRQDGNAVVIADTTIGVTTFDWDGNGGGASTTTIESGVAFVIDASELDVGDNQMDGNVQINGGALTVNTPWVATGTIAFDSDTEESSLHGQALRVQNAGSAFTTDNGMARVTANVTFDGMADVRILGNGGGFRFDGNVSYEGTTVGENAPGMIMHNGDVNVTSDTVVTVSTLDWDGTEPAADPDRTTTLAPGSSLTLNVDKIDNGNDEFNQILQVNGGTLHVNNTAGQWRMAGTLGMDTTSATAEIGGAATIFVDGPANVTGGGVAQLSTPVVFDPGTAVDIAADSELRLKEMTTFQGSSYTGDGILRQNGNATFLADTSIDVAFYDMDGNMGGDTVLTIENVPVTLNVTSVEAGGEGGDFDGTLNIHDGTGKLTVNTPVPWKMDGTLNVINSDDPTAPSIAGQDFELAGTADIAGGTRFDARVDITGEVMLADAGSKLTLANGDVSAANTIQGGVVSGNGTLHLGNDSLNLDAALVGFGTLSADIHLGSNASLLADDGELTLQGALSGPGGTVGTADDDGTLNVAVPWNTAIANELRLNGGAVIGATIFNDGVIAGFGSVATPGLSSNGLIQADGDEALIIDTVTPPDLDGTGSEVGSLEAVAGNLVVVNSLADAFAGLVSVGANRTVVFQSGWTLEGGSDPGQLNLNGGASFEEAARVSGGSMTLSGRVSVTDHGALLAQADLTGTAEVTLASTSDILTLLADATIQSGATFSGAGTLVNGPSSTLTLAQDATVGVTVQNDGQMEIGLSPGMATAEQYVAGPTGVLHIEIGGEDPLDSDRLHLSDGGELGGTLELDLISPFTPSSGQSFTIVTADTAISGKFSEVEGTVTGDNVALAVLYNEFDVTVLAALLGDMDRDGDFDVDDVPPFVLAVTDPGQYQATFGVPGFVHGDIDQDEDLDVDDIEFFVALLVGGGGGGVQSVPEPTAMVLLAVGLGVLALRRRHGRADLAKRTAKPANAASGHTFKMR